MKLTLPPITPGDWRVCADRQRVGWHRHEIRPLRSNAVIAEIVPLPLPGTGEAAVATGRANARAIAALPALLRAFTGLLDQLEGVGIYIPGEDEGQWNDASGLSFSGCEAALILAGCTIEP